MNRIQLLIRRIRLGKNFHPLGIRGSGWECCDGYYGEEPSCKWGNP
jgi:hypothetical protein